MGLSGWFYILIANILIRGYLLAAITNFLNLSNKNLMIVSTDLPHHWFAPLIMWIKEFLLKIVGMVVVVGVVVWINWTEWMFEEGEKIVRWLYKLVEKWA